MNQSLFLLLTYSSFIAVLVLGIWLYQRLFTWETLDRLLASFLPLVILICSELMIRQWLEQPHWPTNASRLAPTLALTQGHPLYHSLDSGPILSTVYGPLTALVYLPATWASSPTNAILIASFIALICFFAPVFWLLFRENWHNPQNRLFAIYIFIGFCFFSLNSPALIYSAFRIHADAPALGFSAMACAMLYYRPQKDNLPALLLSAIFAIFAIWTKQVTLPIIFALPTYILLADGYRTFKRYVFCLIISGIVISGILLVIFNPQLVWLNIVKIPGSQPWTSSNKVTALLGGTRKLMQQSLLPIIIILFYISYQFLFSRQNSQVINLKNWLKQNHWTVLGMVGIFMIPTSVIGSVKVGGDVNALSFTLYFLAVAASLILQKLALEGLTFSTELFNKAAKLLVIIIVLAVVFVEVPPPFPTIYGQLQRLNANSTQVSYEYAKKHPGIAYFPVQPLATLMAEGKLYHSIHGLFDRRKAGLPPDNQHFRQVLPAKLQFVALPASSFSKDKKYISEFLPEFSQKTKLKELSGFTVYIKNPGSTELIM